jgi:hypothetical protein
VVRGVGSFDPDSISRGVTTNPITRCNHMVIERSSGRFTQGTQGIEPVGPSTIGGWFHVLSLVDGDWIVVHLYLRSSTWMNF